MRFLFIGKLTEFALYILCICHLSERLSLRRAGCSCRGGRGWRPHGHGAPELSLGVLDLAAANIDVLNAAAVAAAAAEPLPAAVSARSFFVG